MHVGLVIYGSLDIVTGGFLYDRKLVEYLRSKGDRVEVFSLPWSHYAAHLTHNLASTLIEKIVNAELDILIQDELNHPSLFLTNRRLGTRVAYPIVSIVHHLRCSELRPDWANRLYSIVEKHYLSTLDGFVFNSTTTRATVEALVGTGLPSVVAYPGSDNIVPDVTRDTVASRAADDGPLRILFVGSLIHRKNLHTLIRALARLPRESVHLNVVGSPASDCEYFRLIRETMERLGMEEQVTLLGTLTGNDLARLYGR